MRGISREVLARSATQQVRDAQCAAAGARWNVLEASHDKATSPVESSEIVRKVRSEFCDSCPALAACEQWAQTEQYTGLAAGAAYANGKCKPVAWVSRRPGRVPAQVAS